MTTSRDPDRLIRAFLDEGEEQLHDQIYDAVRAQIEHKRQRAVFGLWRTPTMNKLVLGLGAAAVVVVLIIGAQFLRLPADGNVGNQSTPTPELTPDPTPSTSADSSLPEGPFTLRAEEGLPSITVTIPSSGWSLVPEFGALAKGDEVDNLPEATILLPTYAAGTPFYVSSDPCQWQSTTPETPATTIDQIAAALAAQETRDASEPVDVTVGGYAAKAITLHVPEDAKFSDCEDGEFVSFATSPGVRDRFHQGPGQIDAFWIIDVDGVIVIIDAMYRPDTPDALIEEMRSIAESATFELP